MKAAADPAKLQRAALYRLFDDLFWRGRQTLRHQKTSVATITGRKVVPLLLFAMVGIFMAAFSGRSFSSPSAPVLIFYTLVHAMTFGMVGMMLTSSCSTLLFNDQESDILLHRPVPVAFILRAKVRVMLTQAWLLAVALNLVAMCVGVLRPGGSWRYLPVHLITLGLEALFVVSAVVLAFHLCLRLFGRERLNSLITTSQVVIAMAAMLGGQLVPRLMRQTDLEHWQTSPWVMALPPAWFGALDTLAVTLRPDPTLLMGSALAIGVTALLAWLAFARLAGSYEEAVVTLNEQTSSPGRSNASGQRWTERLTHWPGVRWWLRDPVERAAFLLTAAQLTRARDVKLRVYPQIAQFTVYPLIFAVGGGRSDSSGIMAGLLAGFLGTIPLTAVGLLKYSEEYRGAELFRFVPLASPAGLFHGSRKAAILFVFAPVVVLWVALLLFMNKSMDQLVLLLPGLLVGHIAGLLPGVIGSCVPFSETQVDSRGMGSGCVTMMLGMGSAMAIGFISYFVWKEGWFVQWMLGLTGLCVIVDIIFRRIIRAQPLWTDG
jgi:ABC-2 type transport system permease protein